MKANPNDIPIAYKAISLDGRLTRAQVRVCAAIIDHYNKQTGRCDPSIDRLCGLLGDMNRATVMAATSALAKLGYLAKRSHGGRGHTCAYEPKWSAFRTFVRSWEASMAGGSFEQENEPKRSRKSDVQRRENPTQTHSKNPYNPSTCGDGVEKPSSSSSEQATAPADQHHGRNGLQREGAERRCHVRESLPNGKTFAVPNPPKLMQRHFLLPIPGNKRSQSRENVALEKAKARLNLAMLKGSRDYETIVGSISVEVVDRAAEAEMRRPGTGLAVVYAAMDAQGHASRKAVG